MTTIRAWDAVVVGAVGGTALNIVTYLDMAVRGRPASTTPEETVRRLSGGLGLDLGDEPVAGNRRSGVGALLGYGLAVATGAAVTVALGPRPPAVPIAGGLFGIAAMVASAVPMTVLGVTDPRRWSRADWVSDIVPHLAYGVAAAATWRRLAG